MFNKKRIRVKKVGAKWVLQERRWFIWRVVRDTVFGPAALWVSADTIYGATGWSFYGPPPTGEMEISIIKDHK